jgi:hypothetical protein
VPDNNALEVLTAAVTPVVLVSATAILISGINSRYISIADRLRALAHEYREASVSETRRAAIVREIVAFEHRMHLISRAVRLLNGAVAAFIVDALIISATLWRDMLAVATLPLFLTGIILILVALTFQLLELHSSDRTITYELSDISRAGR